MAASKPAFDQSSSDNPLINPPKLPHGAFAFDKVKVEHFLPALEWALDKYVQEIEEVKNNSDLPSFENTIEALEFIGEDVGRVLSVFHTLSSNNSSDEVRDLEEIFDEKTSPVFSEIAMDDVLFERIKAVHDDASIRAQLDDEQIRLLDKKYKGRVRSGAELSPADKDRLKDISQELSKLTTKFSQNVVKHTVSFERIATKTELDGIPDRTISVYKAAAKAARKKAKQDLKDGDASAQSRIDELKGKYLIKMQPYPSEIFTHCTNRSLRAEISELGDRIGCEAPYDNRPIVLDIVKLRHEKAQLLGYQNHADFVISDRMAGSAKAVEDFLQENLDAYKPQAEEYFKSVKDFAEMAHGVKDFQPHDFGFYGRLLKEQKFSFDAEKMRPYFELGNVFDGFRDHIEKLFNVKMVDCTSAYPSYRDDAQVYEVHDNKTGKVIALFHTDYFAEGGVKRGGAWMNSLQDKAQDRHGNDQIPIITNSCNYQKPPKGEPCLLSLREVETLFHEGGHGFHGALAEGRYESLNGTNVKWDFVELPSQIQENWVAQPEVLKSFAKHYDTGAVIPQEYIDKIKEMSTYGAAMVGLGQTGNGILDLLWHTTDPALIQSVEQVEDIKHKLVSFWPQRSGMLSPVFGHLFSSAVGYSAGYYSYKWAEVLDADMFTEFEKNGLYDPATAQRLRDIIYAQGNRRDPMELFEEMMGRKPDPQALFRREGLLTESNDNTQAAAPKKKKGNEPSP